MKRALVIILILFCGNVKAQSIWQKVYWADNVQGNYGHSVQPTLDGGYILVGDYASAIEAFPHHLYIVKTDSLGDTLWTNRRFGYTLAEGNDVKLTLDGGYLITGSLYRASNNTGYIPIIKLDSTGSIVFYKTYKGFISYECSGNSICVLPSGDFLITGEIKTATSSLLYVGKFNSLGDTIWTREFGRLDSGESIGRSIQLTNDGNYMVVGSTNSFGDNDIYLLKVDTSGNLLWSKTFGISSSDWATSIRQTYDGGLIIGGGTRSQVTSHFVVLLLKTDANGNQLWCKIYDGLTNTSNYCTEQTNDSGFIMTGGYFNGANMDAYLIKTDSGGDTLWTMKYQTTAGEWGEYVRQISDGYIVCGSKGTATNNRPCIYLLKADSLGRTSCNDYNPLFTVDTILLQTSIPSTITYNFYFPPDVLGIDPPKGGTVADPCLSTDIIEPNQENLFYLYPNPATSSLTIKSNSVRFLNQIIISTPEGCQLKTIITPKSEIINVDLSDLRAGIYFFSCITEKGAEMVKVVKTDY